MSWPDSKKIARQLPMFTCAFFWCLKIQPVSAGQRLKDLEYHHLLSRGSKKVCWVSEKMCLHCNISGRRRWRVWGYRLCPCVGLRQHVPLDVAPGHASGGVEEEKGKDHFVVSHNGLIWFLIFTDFPEERSQVPTQLTPRLWDNWHNWGRQPQSFNSVIDQ